MQKIALDEEVVVAEPIASSVALIVVKALSTSFLPESSRAYTFSAELFVGDEETREVITKELAKSVARHIKNYDLSVGYSREDDGRIKGVGILYKVIDVKPTEASKKTKRSKVWALDRARVAKNTEWFNQVAGILSESLARHGFTLTSLGHGLAAYTFTQGI